MDDQVTQQTQKKMVLILVLDSRQGGTVVRYTEVTPQQFEEWHQRRQDNDHVWLAREAPRVLQKRISFDEAEQRLKEVAARWIPAVPVPGVFVEDLA